MFFLAGGFIYFFLYLCVCCLNNVFCNNILSLSFDSDNMKLIFFICSNEEEKKELIFSLGINIRTFFFSLLIKKSFLFEMLNINNRNQFATTPLKEFCAA